ncbi:MAG: TonB-dependent receptor plug domain-containing protein, partial [Pseudomonadota bacterium]
MKTKLLATTLLFGLSGGVWAGAAIAQDADGDVVEVVNETEEEAVQERIVVTGSRLRRPEYTSVFPTEFIGLEEIERNGFSNVADALNATPGFNPGIDPIGGQGANIGANLTSFLGLGVERTLTVVNGRRFVAGDVGGSLAVDLNVIPNALVAGIETVGVGGAPVYGADAIAGTVNILLKEDFEGLDVRGQYGVTEEGDGDNFNVEFTLGANTADGRGNVTFAVQYSDAQGILDTARPDIFTNEPFISNTASTSVDLDGDGVPEELSEIDVDGDGMPDSVFRLFNATGLAGQNVQLFTNGGVASPGAFFLPSLGFGSFGDDFVQFAPNGDLIPFEAGAAIPGTSAFFAQGGNPFDFFDQAGQVISPLERIAFGSTFKYEFNDYVKFKGDFQAANTRSTELTNQGGFQTFAFDDLSGPITVPLSNPFLNEQALGVLAGFGLTDPATDTFVLSRFNNDLVGSGARDSESFVWRISAGLEGE